MLRSLRDGDFIIGRYNHVPEYEYMYFVICRYLESCFGENFN